MSKTKMGNGELGMRKLKNCVANLLIFIFLIYCMVACGKASTSTILMQETDMNYNIINDAYINCKDYNWLKQMNFTPCEAIKQELEKNMEIRKIWNLKFEKCSISESGNSDIIMQAKIENTRNEQFTALFVFINSDNNYYNSKSIFLTSNQISYSLIDINKDNKYEILFDYLLIANGTYRYLEIYQYNEKNVKCIFEEHIDISTTSISYRFIEEVPQKLLMKKNKTYFDLNDKKKIAEKKQYIYQYDGDRYELEEKKNLYNSDLSDFKAYTLG